MANAMHKNQFFSMYGQLRSPSYPILGLRAFMYAIIYQIKKSTTTHECHKW